MNWNLTVNGELELAQNIAIRSVNTPIIIAAHAVMVGRDAAFSIRKSECGMRKFTQKNIDARDFLGRRASGQIVFFSSSSSKRKQSQNLCPIILCAIANPPEAD